MLRTLAVWLALTAGVAVYVGSTVAQACSCSFAGPGRYYVGADGRLPSNSHGIPWAGPHPLSFSIGRSIADRVTVLRHVGGRTEAVWFQVRGYGLVDLIVHEWPGSGTYTVIVREYGDYAIPGDVERDRKGRRVKQALPYEHKITVTYANDPLPDLGGITVQLSPRTRQKVWHAEWRTPSCGVELEADTIDLSVVLPPALEPYRDYLVYTTRVDGIPGEHPHPGTGFPLKYEHRTSKCQDIPPGRTWTEKPGTDRLFSECGERPYGLTPGEHRLSVTIATPGGESSFTTPEITFEIGCDLPPKAAPEPEPAAAPAVEPAPVAPPCPPASPQEPPTTRAPRGCALADPSLAWLAPLLLLGRRRRSRWWRAARRRTWRLGSDSPQLSK